ncbi:MAG: homoserine kinase [Alphaproteobacteria bacterium]|nr:homoserine kinase [Alphaproteobacteria bacterium]
MAVYTPLDEATIRRLVEDYGLGELVGWHGIQAGVENSNFFIETTVRRVILTLYERRVDPADLPFFVGVMEHLAARGVPCPTPLADRDGRVLREVAGRPAACVTFLDGRSVRRATAAQCRALGAALAELHLAGRDYPGARANDLALAGWRRLFDRIGERAEEVAPGLAAELAGELESLEAIWPEALPRGVIHADLFPDNVFFENAGVTGLIDFYFACTDQLAYDLAICLNAWCFERDGAFNTTNARAMTAGYRRVRPLADAEVEALPVLCRGAALRFLLTRLFDWLNHVEGALVTPKDPLEYVVKNRFHRGIRGPGAYGLG